MRRHWADVKRPDPPLTNEEIRRQLGGGLGGKRDPNPAFSVTYVEPHKPEPMILDLEDGSID
jgi:hypothetical protein